MTNEQYDKILKGFELMAENQLKLFQEVQELKKLIHQKSRS